MDDVKNIGLDKTKQLIELFFNTTPQIINQLEKDIANKDSKAIGMSAHKLKGAASSIGLSDLHRCTSNIESCARDQADNVQQLFDQLQPVYQDSCQVLRRAFEDISQSLPNVELQDYKLTSTAN